MDVYHKSLCFDCQERTQRYLDIRSGKLKVVYEKISKCVRCGAELPEVDSKKPYCASCSKKISGMKDDNPFSPTEKFGASKSHYGMNSDHYD
jgi:hypothetical protein